MFVFLPSYSLIVTVKSWESSWTKLFYLYKQNKTSILFFGDELTLISKPTHSYWVFTVCQLISWQPPGALWFSHKERNVWFPFAMPSPFIYLQVNFEFCISLLKMSWQNTKTGGLDYRKFTHYPGIRTPGLDIKGLSSLSLTYRWHLCPMWSHNHLSMSTS